MGLGAPSGVRAASRADRPPVAAELTVEQAWFLGERLGAGAFPWALAITAPYQDERQRVRLGAQHAKDLAEVGVVGADGSVDPSVAGWIHTVCRPDRWLELRYVVASPHADGDPGSAHPKLLRGFVARTQSQTVVALRNAQLVAFTAIEADEPSALVPSVVAGLSQRAPAQFPEFTLPAEAGAKADEKLRSGASLDDVVERLGIPPAARPVVQAALRGRRSYVEVVAGQRDGAAKRSTEVGVSVVDTGAGRVLVSPRRAADGVWLSTFAPGTPFAIAVAVDQLTAELPEGRWFPNARLTKSFN
ncbi:ESX secretion-associated protein EspG [Segniliparus rugosus]|uniref:ESX secretion-associated protein EspG n=1 Tax=Segniliparus rugosus (strain ATCC BAA-974 / DSM 45345 / CCUG 50838 / CIP 108380 / JCM 13579 / CDC 945) TaxID=679197 RepID=E5XM56_SEGRC|nr:ESX secretion-associated protein EspG [Segniliparus rugosus]EFV14568.1 hypothetical protein HMPREF9336_00576 [Segniliparus rugosus ATCC BAA-974]